MIFILFLCLIWNNCNLEMVQRLMGPFHWIIKCGGGPPLPSPLLPSLTVVCCPPCLGGSDSWTGPAVPGSGSPATACAAPQSSPPPLSACSLNINHQSSIMTNCGKLKAKKKTPLLTYLSWWITTKPNCVSSTNFTFNNVLIITNIDIIVSGQRTSLLSVRLQTKFQNKNVPT